MRGRNQGQKGAGHGANSKTPLAILSFNVYTITMEIIWDEPKRLANLIKHGFDFANLSEEFFVSSMIIPANHKRWMAIGILTDGVIAVVFARMGSEGISIISMRRASVKERRFLT